MTERLSRSIDAPFDQNATENYPYVLTVPGEASGQEAILVGVKHAYDPDDPRYPRQFELELGLWEHFIRDHVSSDCIAIVEGGLRKLEEGETPESAYRRDAEPCMLTLLAEQAGVQVISGEPDIVEGAKVLLGQIVPENVTDLPYYEVFDQDKLAYWHYMKFAMQTIGAASNGTVITDYDAYVRHRPTMVQLIDAAPELGLDFSLESLQIQHAKYCPDLPFNPLVRTPDGLLHDPEDYRERLFIPDGNAMPEEYKAYDSLQRLGTFYGKEYRDQELTRLVTKYRKLGASVFSFEGGGHWLRVGRQLPDILHIPREALQLYVGAVACQELLTLDEY
jgi:hypothetical protein